MWHRQAQLTRAAAAAAACIRVAGAPPPQPQGATRSLVAPLSKGCDWGQDVPRLLQQHAPGLALQAVQRHLAGTLVSISATKA